LKQILHLAAKQGYSHKKKYTFIFMWYSSFMTNVVEIIPWVHDITTRLHREVITYLLTLPKGSVLLLEGNPTNHIIYDRILNKLLGYPVKPIEIKKVREKEISVFTLPLDELTRQNVFFLCQTMLSPYAVTILPALEIFFVCRTRGITIFSLDSTNPSYKTVNFEKYELETFTYDEDEEQLKERMKKLTNKYLAIQKEREKQMVENIRALAITRKKIYILAGVAHSLSLKKQLDNDPRLKGIISTRIATEFSSKPKALENLVKRYYEIHHVNKQNIYEINEAISEPKYLEEQVINFSDAKKNLLTNINKYAQRTKERLLIKVAKKKMTEEKKRNKSLKGGKREIRRPIM